MKKLICELCGSVELVKEDGLFVCQSCGCKYTVEEAKKIMFEGTIHVDGKVKIDNSNQISNMMINANRAYEDGRFDQAQVLYNQILNEEPNNYEAILYEGLSLGWQGNAIRYTMNKAGNSAIRAIDIAKTSIKNDAELDKFIIKAMREITKLGIALSKLCMQTIQEYNISRNDKISDLDKRIRRADVAYVDFNIFRDEYEIITNSANSNIQKYAQINDNTLLIILSVYNKVVSCFANDFQRNNKELFDYIEDNINSLIKIICFPISKAEFSSVLYSIEFYKEYKEERDKANYWIKHPEEKKKYDEKVKQDKIDSLYAEAISKIYSEDIGTIKEGIKDLRKYEGIKTDVDRYIEIAQENIEKVKIKTEEDDEIWVRLKKNNKKKAIITAIIAGVIVVVGTLAIIGLYWYNINL